MKIELPTTVTVDLSDNDLAVALFCRAVEMCGDIDDAGCDWYTDDEGNTYIAEEWTWVASRNPTVAAMIDLYHALTGSDSRKFKMQGSPPASDELQRYEGAA